MNHEHINFLDYVQRYVQENPEVSAYVSDFVASGLRNSLRAANERAADMECDLSIMIAKRFTNRESFVLDKLEKWNGKSSLEWTSTIEMLKGKD